MRQGCMLPAEGARAARSTMSRTTFSETGFGRNARQEYRVETASFISTKFPFRKPGTSNSLKNKATFVCIF
jgi:hypothetical protein